MRALTSPHHFARTITSTTLALALPAAVALLPAPSPTAAAASDAVITAPAQTITGFGASGAWWVDDLANFAPSVQSQVANLLFTGSGIELSQYRYNIGGGGVGVTGASQAAPSFLTAAGTYDWSADPGGRYFLQAAAADGVPDLIGFVNSAPSQYTTNGRSCGGALDTADDAAYGSYIATIASHFAAQGVKIDQISPMNEPDDAFGTCGQEGMSVPAADRAGVIDAIGSALRSAGLSTQVIADESSQTTQLLSEAPTWLANSTAAGDVQAIAHHTYDMPGGGQLEQVGALADTSGKPVWATEICCQKYGAGYTEQYDPTMTGALPLANDIYTDLSFADDSAFQWWLALSGGLGCDPTASSSCTTSVNSSGWNDGLIYYDKNYASDGNQSLYPSKRFYVLGQYSKFVRPGAVRYGVSGSPSGVQTTAFWHDNQWTVVATNTNSSSTTLNFDLGSGTLTSVQSVRTDASQNMASISAPGISDSAITAALPAQSVTTYVLGSSGTPGSAGVNAHQLVGTQSGKCLDVPGASTVNGTQFDIRACDGGGNQQFTLRPNGEISVYGGSTEKCLDAYQQAETPGTIVDAYACNGGRNQLWQAHPDGSITNDESGLCLEVKSQGTADGSAVDLWTCNGGGNQQWSLD